MNEKDAMYKPFNITSVCRADLTQYITEEQALKITDDQMLWLASKIGDGIMEDFWIVLQDRLDEIINEQK